jgi:hypothetical protein
MKPKIIIDGRIINNCEENKSNNFFVGKQKIKFVNNTFFVPLFYFPWHKKIKKLFQITKENHSEVSKPREKNNLLFYLNIA